LSWLLQTGHHQATSSVAEIQKENVFPQKKESINRAVALLMKIKKKPEGRIGSLPTIG
jgi:hypothetical protein